MHNVLIPKTIISLLGLVLLAGCSNNEPPAAKTVQAEAPVASGAAPSMPRPEYAPLNPYLADSVMPIGHFNSAQTTGVEVAGPSGPSGKLSQEDGDLTYTHLGPGHFGMAISGEYPNGKRVIWRNGAERISKLDYDTLEVIGEYFLENSPTYKNNGGPISAEQADSDIKRLDRMPTFGNSGLNPLFRRAN